MSDLLESLPAPLQHAVRREVENDEETAWVGQPSLAAVARGARRQVVFGLVFVAFGAAVAYWAIAGVEASRHLREGGLLIGALLLGLLAVGLLWGGGYMATTPLRRRRRARETAFLITTKRAIVFDAMSGPGREVRSIPWARVRQVSRREQADDSGDVLLEAEPRYLTFRSVQRAWEVEKTARRFLHSSAGPGE